MLHSILTGPMTDDDTRKFFGSHDALNAWEQYIATLGSLVTQLAAGLPLPSTVTTSLAALLPGQELLERLGMSPRAVPKGAANLPALGPAREYQEMAQRLLILTERFRTLYAQYAETIADVHRAATRALGQRVASEANLLDSPSRAYHIWIDGAEAAYAQAVHTESFAKLFGSMCNLLADFRNERAQWLAHMARLWDLPSRTEVDALHQQVRALTTAARRSAIKDDPHAPKKRTGKTRQRRGGKR